MTRFGTAMAHDSALGSALDHAIGRAKDAIGETPVALAVVFASHDYEGIETIADLLRAKLPGVRFVGGTSAASVFDTHEYEAHGVSVSLLGGTDVVATTRAVADSGIDLLAVAATARDIRTEGRTHEAEGRGELACLAFAPSQYTGDSLVAALKKGATTHAQLAGALLSQGVGLGGGLVWSDVGGLSATEVIIAGLFTEKPIGVAARHGWKLIGSPHRVTRTEGPRLHALDGRPAIEVWLEEARLHGGDVPDTDLAVYLASNYELAILGTELVAGGEPIVRGSRAVNADGSVDLFGSIPEGAQVQLVTATEDDMYAAAKLCATRALENAGGSAAGALGLMCVGRSHVLGARYRNEPRLVAETLGVPFGGTTVNGEIALGRRDANGFYNSTAVVIAFPE